MNHAQSLRVIGQMLEIARVSTFQLDSDGRTYVMRSNSMSRTAEWMLRYVVRDSDLATVRESTPSTPLGRKPIEFSDAALARLNDREAKRRRDFTSQEEPPLRLSQLLRAVGDYLDRMSARSFHILWMPFSVVVDYKGRYGLTDRHQFTNEELRQIGKSGLRRISLPPKK